MPIYEYRCTACGVELEKLQKINDPLLKDCPECGKAALSRLVSASSFRLKGSGWYETDFKKSGQRHLADSGGSAADSNADKAPATADSAAKTETTAKTKSGGDAAAGPAPA